MEFTPFALALALCFTAVAYRSPKPAICIATIAAAVIVSTSTRKRRKPGLVSSPPPSPPSPSPSLSSSSSSSNLSSTSSRINYDVFLSFRGPDTRKGFTDCLYHQLRDAGINVFRDDHDLCPGEEIINALIESIKQSKISIPIISKDYASSRSCLMELAKMLECKKAYNQRIMPIFYDIEPAELKHPRGCVKESFRAHEKRGVKRTDIDKWKQALKEITAIKGHDLRNTYNGHQGELIKKVVSDVQRFLKTNDLVMTDRLVGIEPHVQEVMRKLGIIYADEQATEICGKDVHVLGICGMPGVGKTTLAKFVYNKIHHLFQGCSFLSKIPKNFESNGLMDLQKMLISDLRKQEPDRLSTPDKGIKVIAHSFKKKTVLILIDDVHDLDQIEHLVGDLSWFGPSSRILMTVKRGDILDKYTPDEADKYELKKMDRDQALQLFRDHAFYKYPLDKQHKYDSLCEDFVDYIDGLPLAIKVTASYLRNKKRKIWHETLARLKNSKPEDAVKRAFEVSYDSLERGAQQIFLDIACFFIEMDERIPTCMWSACQYDPSRGIQSLCDRYLVKTVENHGLWMHNQLRDFGREIVQNENDWPWKRSRLWNHEDALSVLNGKESAENVEALALTFDEGGSECFRCKGFGHHWSLRFLRLDRAIIERSCQDALSKLRWLHWQGCSEISELLILHLKNLVILDLSRSLVTGDSQLWGQILEKASNLKVLKLSGCRGLRDLPDFRASMNLERLILEGCSMLSQISRSIGSLKNLVSLNLKFCKFVKKLPEELCYMKILKELLIDGTSICVINFQPDSMDQLKILSACQCESLACISDSIDQLTSLTYLGLDGAAIDRLPHSIGSLKKLRRLLLGNCWKLPELPYSIGNLKSLEIMDLSSTKIDKLPRSVKNLEELIVLKMENTHLRKFPIDIKNLDKLEEIDLSQCKNLKGPIRCDMKGLSSLKILRLSSTKTSGLPWSDEKYSHHQTLSSLSLLQRLDLSDCDQVRALPKLPPYLSSLRWRSKKMRTVPDLSYLNILKELYLGDIADPMQKSSSEPPQIGWVTSLKHLEILELRLSKITLPKSFSALRLRKLVLHYADLLDLRELPSSLSTLCLRYCQIQVPQFSKARSLSELELKHCDLEKIDNLEELKLLRLLEISHCKVKTLDGLENMPRLRKLTLLDCPSLTEPLDRTKYNFEIDMRNC